MCVIESLGEEFTKFDSFAVFEERCKKKKSTNTYTYLRNLSYNNFSDSHWKSLTAAVLRYIKNNLKWLNLYCS